MNCKVSVLVPVFNDPTGIENILHSLVRQSYPKHLYEIIVIDNGSTDKTYQVASKFQQNYPDMIKVLVEDSIQSSYAARNTGYTASKGEIIAMIDADCTPIPEWIENGVYVLHENNADMVGGKVAFQFSSKPGPAEMYDAISNMQMKQNIEERGVAKTANLFVRRTIFESIGPFPPNLKSGGDVNWTGKATHAGFRLIYSEKPKVTHPTRQFKALLMKQHRVGTGQPAIWKKQGYGNFVIFIRILRYFLPQRIIIIKSLINKRGTKEMQKYWLSIWSVSWLCEISANIGRIQAVLGLMNEN